MMVNNIVCVMGVSGIGKTAIGNQVAKIAGCPFIDADTLHSPENIAKMSSGKPLTDTDRDGWLDAVCEALHISEMSVKSDGERVSLVLACSCLRRRYRDRLRAAVVGFRARLQFVFPEVDRSIVEARLQRRPGHFFPGTLLQSQLETLEPLSAEEPNHYTVQNDTSDHGTRAAVTIAVRSEFPLSLASSERAISLLCTAAGVSRTPFQRSVLAACLAVPRGQVATYKSIAIAVGSPNSSRGVGQVLRSNPFAPLVPCHRVVASSMKLNGFNGSMNDSSLLRKRKLLEDEGVTFATNKKFVVNMPATSQL